MIGSSIEGENHMDTNLPSPKRPSSKSNGPKLSGALSTILSVGAVLWVIGGAAGVATAQTASAQTAPSATQVTYADLDLSTEAGARILLRRINLAAHEACADVVHSPLLPRAAVAHGRCVATATRTAIDAVGSVTVANAHRLASEGTFVAAR
jgi:UrcA family protein